MGLPPVVNSLQALRGVPFTVAVTTVAALGDRTRLETPRELMKCLGLIPSEYSTAVFSWLWNDEGVESWHESLFR